MKPKLLAALAASMFAGAAEAAILRYDLVGTVPGKFTARFELDSERTPSVITPFSVRYNGVSITYIPPGGTERFENDQFDGPTFQTALNQGGFFFGFLQGAPNDSNRIQVGGPQLFSGTTAAPTLLTGVFLLSDVPRSRDDEPLQVNYRLTITDVTAGTVPEPATWAMLILGVGAVGSAMRRRQAWFHAPLGSSGPR